MVSRNDIELLNHGIVRPSVRDRFARRAVREIMDRNPTYRGVDKFTRNNLFDALIDGDRMQTVGHHRIQVFDAEGRLKQDVGAKNIVTTVGKAHMLNAELASGAQVTTWYLGLIAIPQAVPSGTTGGVINTASVAGSAVLTFGASYPWTQNELVTVFGSMTAGATNATFFTTASATGGSASVNTPFTGTASSLTAVFGPNFLAADTAASHANWAEVASANITQGARPAITFTTTATNAISNGTAVTYNMASGLAGVQYLYGVFITTLTTLQGATGTLFSEAAPSAGALAVQASYQISDTYTLTLN